MIRGGYWGGAWGLSWGGAWGEAWLLLNQPYQELSLKGQVFVRSYLTSIHSAEVAEQIVSAAKVNGLSVRDAEVAVAAKVGETVLHAVKTRSVGAVEKPRRVKLADTKQPSGLAAKYFQQSLSIEQRSKSFPVALTEIQLVTCRKTSRADVVNYYL